MAEQTADSGNFRRIYEDTNYFIHAIISDYGFYGSFIDAVKRGSAEFDFKRKNLTKTIDEQWLDVIEECLPALDNVIRRPSKYIEERDEVMPIELSHNITSRSLQHLAQHTDYIQKIEGDMITPSKILNIFHDETMMTYENKFVNTLIYELYIFVNKRFVQMAEQGDSAVSATLDFSSEFDLGDSSGKIRFSVETQRKNDLKNGVSLSDRVSKLNSVVTRYLNSDFTKAMGKSYVRPPIMRTNAITKNKELRHCLALWEFIQSYDKVGYEISVQESSEKPNEAYINELYSLLSLQYMMFRYNLEDDITRDTEILAQNENEQPLSPVFRRSVEDIRVEDYDVYDAEYRRVVPVSSLSSRRLSPGEIRIRDAVDTALAAEKLLSEQRRAQERKRAAELKAQQKLVEERKKAAEEKQKKLEEKKLRAKLARRKPGRPKRKPHKKNPPKGTNA